MSSTVLALLLAVQETPPPAEPPPPPIVSIPPVILAPPPPMRPVYAPAPPPPPSGIRPPVHVSGTITNNDYPAAAIRAEHEGTVTARLTVGVSGRSEGCTVTRSSGSAVLDSTTCALLVRRFRFDPARDEKGRAVAGTVTRTVRWELPDDYFTPPYFVSGRVVVAQWSSPMASCASLSSTALLAPIGPDLCAEAFRSSPEAARTAPSGRPTVAVLSISASAVEPALPRAPGRIVYREDASFEVAPSGEVIACHPNIRLNATPHSAFDLCRYLATEDGPFFAPSSSAAARRHGRMTLEMYETGAPVDPVSLLRP